MSPKAKATAILKTARSDLPVTVDDEVLDPFEATLIEALLRGMSREQKLVYLSRPIGEMSDFAWRMLGKPKN